MQLLQDVVSRANCEQIAPRLANFGEHVAYRLNVNNQPAEDILEMDVANFPTIANVYNSRFPELRMEHMDSPSALFAALSNRNDTAAWRAVVRIADGAEHHITVDVRTREGQAPTVIVMEPAAMRTFMPNYWNLMRQAQAQLGHDIKWAFIEVGAQKSPADCVIFGMNHALAAFQKSDLFDEWHENLDMHGTLASPDDVSERFLASPDPLMEAAGIKLFNGSEMLPAVFYKHTHSKTVIEDLNDNQPGARDKDVSTSVRERKSESLSDRIQAFTVSRGEREYSVSIEASRATKIRTALSRML